MSRTTHPYDPAQPATAADALLRALEADGVEVVFGLPGGAALPLYDALARGTTRAPRPGPPRAGRRPHGAGLRTGVRSRWASSSPPPAPAPRTSSRRSPTRGRTRRRSSASPARSRRRRSARARSRRPTSSPSSARSPRPPGRCVIHAAWRRRCATRSASRAPGATGRCSSTCRRTSSRSTAPLRELLAGLAEEPAPPPWRPLDARAVERAARLLADAERPVLVVGGGVVAAGAAAEVLALAETAGAPVVTTLMAKGAFPETHALHVGIPGMHGTKTANWALDRADLVVGVGTRFDDRMTGRHDAFAPGARIVHLDVDPEELDRLVAADVGIAAPLRPALQALHGALRPLAGDAATRLAPWRAQLAEWQEAFPLRYAPLGRRAQAAGGARGAARPHRRPRRRRLHHRRRPAPDVGDAVPRVHGPAPVRVLRRPGHDGLRPAGGRRRARARGRTPPWSASTATARSR